MLGGKNRVYKRVVRICETAEEALLHMLAIGRHKDGPHLIRNDFVLLVGRFDLELNDAAAGLTAQTLLHRRDDAGDRVAEADRIREAEFAADQGQIAPSKRPEEPTRPVLMQ